MSESTGLVRPIERQAVILPRYVPAGGLVVAIGAGLCFAGPAGSQWSGGRMASLLNAKPLPLEVAVERRRRTPSTAAATLSEIRRRTNLAWGTIAEILGVSRKAVHNWASGEEPTLPHAAQLAALHERAEDLHARHGPSGAGNILAIESGVVVKIARTSTRALPEGVPPLLYAADATEAAPLRLAGGRKRVRLRSS